MARFNEQMRKVFVQNTPVRRQIGRCQLQESVVALHLEYIVLGPPISNQAAGANGAANKVAWMAKVRTEAAKVWNRTSMQSNLKAIIINFFAGKKPSVDTDNMSKPILDVMQSLVYDDDRQIRQAELSHVPIDAPMVIAGASQVLVNAIQAGRQFVYVRIEDPVIPLPLPR